MGIRRPLFWAALFLVAISWLRFITGKPGAAPPGMADAQSLGIGSDLTLSGQVYKKDSHTYYLQDVSVRMQSFNGSGDLSPDGESDAGPSRRSISCKDNIICKLEGEELPLGCYVTLQGSFAPVQAATNPGEFDAAAYYRTLGVGGRLSRASVLETWGTCWPVREWLYGFRMSLKERLKKAMPEEEAGILCALLLGDRTELSETTQELYRQSGILHILSISSLHITILGMGLHRLLRRLGVPVWMAALGGSVFLLLYGTLTGFSVSACRAVGMYLIRMLGEILGRTYDMLTALGAMGALMVWRNPYYLENSGFLLSYASVLGAGGFGPVLGKLLEEGEKPPKAGAGRRAGELQAKAGKWLRQSALTSLGVTLATMPVQLRYFYEVPVYSALLNLLVLPFVKPLMLLGLLLLAFPWCYPAAEAAGWILGWYARLCGLCGSMPFHTWNPGCPRPWQIAAYYSMLAIAVIAGGKLRQAGKWRKKGINAAVALAFAGAVAVLGLTPGRKNCVTFLDVGQGDCIVVQTASGETYLFDCGSSSRSGVGEYVLVPFLKYNGIRTLDAVFASHPDADHINGLIELLGMGGKSGITVRQMVLPDIDGERKKEQLGELTEAAEGSQGTKGAAAHSVPVRYICAGEGWECESARFVCLHPAKGWQKGETNAYSECFYVEFFDEQGDWKGMGGVSMLLTGDVEGEGEIALLEQLARNGTEKIDILKAAHHGSGGATSEALLEKIRPGVTVISCGRKNRYGHPHPELLERLEKAGSTVLQTAEGGAVTIWPERDGMRVRLFGAGG